VPQDSKHHCLSCESQNPLGSHVLDNSSLVVNAFEGAGPVLGMGNSGLQQAVHTCMLMTGHIAFGAACLHCRTRNLYTQHWRWMSRPGPWCQGKLLTFRALCLFTAASRQPVCKL
jgi:hypothetical protein